MSETEIERVLWAFRERMLDLKHDRRLRYILVFKNHGAAAGATLEHPHSQLIALPIVPDFVRDEIEGARRHFAAEGALRVLRHRPAGAGRRRAGDLGERRLRRAAPYAPRFAFETWLLPQAPRRAVRGGAAPGVREPGADAEGGAAADRPRAESPPFNLVVHTRRFERRRRRVSTGTSRSCRS